MDQPIEPCHLGPDEDGGNCGRPGCPRCGNPAGKKVLGRVTLGVSYVVDLGNKDMVEHAMEACVEDVMDIVKFDNFDAHIKIVPDATLVEADIQEFLTEEQDDDEGGEA